MRGRLPSESEVALPLERGSVVHGLNAEHRAAVGEAGEAVGVWFDAVHPLEELRAVICAVST